MCLRWDRFLPSSVCLILNTGATQLFRSPALRKLREMAKLVKAGKGARRYHA